MSHPQELSKNRCPAPGSSNRTFCLFSIGRILNDWIAHLGGHPQAKTPNLRSADCKERYVHQRALCSTVLRASRACFAERASAIDHRWYSNGFQENGRITKKNFGRRDGSPAHTFQNNNGYKTLAAGKVFPRNKATSPATDYWTENTRPQIQMASETRPHTDMATSGKKAVDTFHSVSSVMAARSTKSIKRREGNRCAGWTRWKTDIAGEGMPTKQIATGRFERLNQGRTTSPSSSAVGFIRPHVPFTGRPKVLRDLYPMKDLNRARKSPMMKWTRHPLHGKAMRWARFQGGDHEMCSASGRIWKEMTRGYLACISFWDGPNGLNADALEASPTQEQHDHRFLRQNHGQHIGEKRHWRKQALWEEATRVPLSIHVPGCRPNAGKKCVGSSFWTNHPR